jgi:hypothetical protein
MRRIAGRDFSPRDNPGSPPVAIVNQSLARALFANANPLGRTIRFKQDKAARQFEIIGVIADSRYYDLHLPPQPAAWFTFQDDAGLPYMPTLHVRAHTADTAAIIATVRHEIDSFDKGFPVFNVKTLQVRIEDALARERILANLSGAVGFLALVLAAVGLYGVLAYSVSRRTREFGIRMALGSSARFVLWMVAREAFLLVALGSLAGLTLSLAGWQILSRNVPGVSPVDAPILAVCAAVMLAVAAAAVTVPAMRACRIDPLLALRHE